MLEQLAAESLAPTACTTIEEVGSTGVGALTITFLILAVSTIVFIARTGSAKSQKIYYYCNVFVCGFATMSYFAMLSGQGWTAIAGCRQFFYARYVDWSITTPLLLLDLGLIAGADGALIAAAIGADCKLILRIVLASCSPSVFCHRERAISGDSKKNKAGRRGVSAGGRPIHAQWQRLADGAMQHWTRCGCQPQTRRVKAQAITGNSSRAIEGGDQAQRNVSRVMIGLDQGCEHGSEPHAPSTSHCFARERNRLAGHSSMRAPRVN